MIEVDVRKRLGEAQIDASFSLDGPGITVLFGRSGAGKTSIVNMIAGLIRPDEGRIRIGDSTMFDSQKRIDIRAHRRRVGYVFQDARLFPHLDVHQNLIYGMRRGPETDADRVGISLDEVGELLGISKLFGRSPAQLSGGEKQRVSIGRALLSNPQVLLLDEPLASLDLPRKNEILPYIADLPRRFRIPLLYVSHSMDEILRLADNVVYLRDGKTLQSGLTEKVLNSPELQAYVSGEQRGTVLRARVIESNAQRSLCRVEESTTTLSVARGGLQPGAAVRFRVAAEDIILATEIPKKTSVQNIVEARIVGGRQTTDGLVQVELDIGVGLSALVSQRAWTDLELAPGARVYVLVKGAALARNLTLL